MIEAIKIARAIRRLKQAKVFIEMRVIDRGGIPQARFLVKHHGVTSWMSRRAALHLVKTMERIEWENEVKRLVKV